MFFDLYKWYQIAQSVTDTASEANQIKSDYFQNQKFFYADNFLFYYSDKLINKQQQELV